MTRFVDLNNGRQLQSDEGRALLVGELETFRSVGGPALPRADRIVVANDKATARVPAREGSHPDLYFFLKREADGWHIFAFRSLALTGVIEVLRRLLKEAPQRTAEEELTLRNTELVLAPDKVLIEWARENRDFLERVRREPRSPALEEELKRLGGNRIHVENDILIVSIGGILDNEVGFMLAPEGKVPALDPRSYIWIEPTGTGWHLFKTT